MRYPDTAVTMLHHMAIMNAVPRGTHALTRLSHFQLVPRVVYCICEQYTIHEAVLAGLGATWLHAHEHSTSQREVQRPTSSIASSLECHSVL
jgi:hypothetical protein